MRLCGVVAAVAVALSAGAATAEDAPNPEFASWAKFKPGTSITLKTASRLGELSREATVTMTLVEVGADKLVTEVAFAGKVYGIEGAAGPVKRDVPKVVAGAGKKGADPRRPDGTFEEGTETLTISGNKIKATWYKFKSEAGGAKTEGTVWVSDDAPVSVVKQTITTTSGKFNTTETTELTEFKKP